MSRLEKISSRLPRLYMSCEKSSLIFNLLQAIDRELNNLDEGITDLMKSHWVDSAVGEDLDKLAVLVSSYRTSEADLAFRRSLKKTVEEYKGGGTLAIFLERLNDLLSPSEKDDFEIIENPRIKTSAEFLVVAGDTWILGSESIKDEEPTLTLSIDGKGEVTDPRIVNIDTNNSISFKGKLPVGKQLKISQKKALLGEQEITNKVNSEDALQLFRKKSEWKYTESLSEVIGIFDTAKFDENNFAVGIPTIKVRFDWEKSQPSVILIKIKSRVLLKSGLTEQYLEKTLNSMKAAGVKVVLKVTE
jgi:hypothetical protein